MARSRSSRSHLPAKRHDSGFDLARAREKAAERARFYAGKAKSQNTTRAYAGDWKRFQAWCEAMQLVPLPAEPETLAAYLGWLADQGKATSTVGRAAAAIGKAHEVAGRMSPTKHPGVKLVLDGIRREKTVTQHGKEAILREDLRAMVATFAGDSLLDFRNRALLAFGWVAALRREELVAIDVEHLAWEGNERVRLTIPRSKTDQEGEGQHIGVLRLSDFEICGLTHLEAWLAEAGIDTGPVFVGLRGPKANGRLHPQAVWHVVKIAAKRAGLDLTRYGAHSLRAGYVTQAFYDGAREAEIRRVTRHTSEDMTRRYIRPLDVFDHIATERMKNAKD